MLHVVISLLSFILLCATPLLQAGDAHRIIDPTLEKQLQHHTSHTWIVKFALLPNRQQDYRTLLRAEPEEREDSTFTPHFSAASETFSFALRHFFLYPSPRFFPLTTLNHARKAWLFSNLYSRYVLA
ncbi:hypothetical protein O1E19_001971 [Vibrio cholerae]